ncbi:MAG: hypothetical protein AAF558_08200 [Verrucomicrobiota bacterium]
MDTSRFKSGIDTFSAADFIAQFTYKTNSSILFDLGSYSNSLYFAKDDMTIKTNRLNVFNIEGWLDVHHPCHDNIKAKIRVALPSKYLEKKMKNRIIKDIFKALSIPFDETFQATFISSDIQMDMSHTTLLEEEEESEETY